MPGLGIIICLARLDWIQFGHGFVWWIVVSREWKKKRACPCFRLPYAVDTKLGTGRRAASDGVRVDYFLDPVA